MTLEISSSSAHYNTNDKNLPTGIVIWENMMMKGFIFAAVLCVSATLAVSLEPSRRSATDSRVKNDAAFSFRKKSMANSEVPKLRDAVLQDDDEPMMYNHYKTANVRVAAEEELDYSVRSKGKARRRRRRRRLTRRAKRKLEALKKKALKKGKGVKKKIHAKRRKIGKKVDKTRKQFHKKVKKVTKRAAKRAKRAAEKAKKAAKRAKIAAKRARRAAERARRAAKRLKKIIGKNGGKRRKLSKHKRKLKRKRRRHRGWRIPKLPPKKRYPPVKPPMQGPRVCQCRITSKPAKECYSFTNEGKGYCELRYCGAKWECITGGRSRHLCIRKFATEKIEPIPGSYTKCRKRLHPARPFWAFYRRIQY